MFFPIVVFLLSFLSFNKYNVESIGCKEIKEGEFGCVNTFYKYSIPIYQDFQWARCVSKETFHRLVTINLNHPCNTDPCLLQCNLEMHDKEWGNPEKDCDCQDIKNCD